MAKPGTTTVDLHRGDNLDLEVTVRNPAGTAVNIAGSTVKFQIARTVSGPAVVEKTTSDGVVLTSPADGLLTVSLVPADTASLAPGDYYLEVQLIDDSNKSYTVLSGTLRLLPALIVS